MIKVSPYGDELLRCVMEAVHLFAKETGAHPADNVFEHLQDYIALSHKEQQQLLRARQLLADGVH